MNRIDILVNVIEIITEQLYPFDTEKKLDTSSKIMEFGADSLDHLELIMLSEERFNVKMSDQEAANVKTVGDAVDLVARLLGVE